MIHDIHCTWYTCKKWYACTHRCLGLVIWICMYKEVSHEVQITTDDANTFTKYCLGYYTFVK